MSSTVSVLVLGANGMLGSMVCSKLALEAGLEVTGTVRTKAEIQEAKRAFPGVQWADLEVIPSAEGVVANVLGLGRFDWIINCIGIIKQKMDPRRGEDVETTVLVNSLFPHWLAKLVGKSSTRIIQIATDCVYSGAGTGAREDRPHDPLDVYGKTKSLGEVDRPGFFNVRCSIIGPELSGRFSLMEWFLGQGPGATVRGFTDHFWNGVTTLQFARLCSGIIRSEGSGLAGTQHWVPADTVSKYELLKILATHFNRSDVQILEHATGESVDRTLGTLAKDRNLSMWKSAGYQAAPTIDRMIAELADFQYPRRR